MHYDGLGGLLEKQSSVASRGQLLALGMNDNVMQYRLRRGGPWQTLLPGVYLAASGIPSMSQKEMAALLYAGPGSLVTGPMALLHHSIRGGSAVDFIDVLVPMGRQRLSTDFARLHRTTRMPSRASSIGPVRLAPVPRAVADTVRQLTELRDVRAVVADAVQLGRCSLSELAEELRTGPVKGSAKFRSVLAEVVDYVTQETKARLIYDSDRLEGLAAENEEEMEHIARFVEQARTAHPKFDYQRNGIYLRFCHSDYHKGAALAELARLIDVPRDNIFAAGDHHNDISMLDGKVAAMPSCPANAIAEVQSAVDAANARVSRAESIRKFTILDSDFTEESGHLTPSLKLKRNVVMRDFEDEVDALYGG